MLAGYLPFDDDPANPEGDNINLLYKYIVSTPLTFPEYVTPHARDLLRRILVPDPRKRADLFEVARHSWLSDYAHVVSFITSTSTTNADLNPAAPSTESHESGAPGLGRSASVREPTKPSPMIGGPGRSPAIPASEDRQKKDRDAKRRTVQLEYVAPQSQTARGEVPQIPSAYAQGQPSGSREGKSRSRGQDSRPGDISPVPEAPAASSSNQRPVTLNAMAPPTQSRRNQVPRAVSDSTAFVSSPVPSNGRPSTRGSVSGTPSAPPTARLPSRGNSYGQPAAATVAPTTVEGRFAQPQRNSMILTGPMADEISGRDPNTGRPMSQQFPVGYQPRPAGEARPRHKRTNTVESITSKIFGRSNSSRRQSQAEGTAQRPEKKNRQYPPVSMNNTMPVDSPTGPRKSTESRRSSIGFGRKDSDDPSANKRASKRFSFIPQALSRMSLTGGAKEDSENRRPVSQKPPSSRHDSKMLSGMAFGQGRSRTPSQETSNSSIPALYDSQIDRPRNLPSQSGPQRGVTAPNLTNFAPQDQYGSSYQPQPQQHSGYRPTSSQQQERFYTPSQTPETQATESSLHPPYNQSRPLYPPGFNESENQNNGRPSSRQPATLQKPNRKFGEEAGNSGSSSGARRVMNWFRSRGKERGG